MLPTEGISGSVVHFIVVVQMQRKKSLDCRKILSPFPSFYLLLVIFFFLIYLISDVQIISTEDSTFGFWPCLEPSPQILFFKFRIFEVLILINGNLLLQGYYIILYFVL